MGLSGLQPRSVASGNVWVADHIGVAVGRLLLLHIWYSKRVLRAPSSVFLTMQCLWRIAARVVDVALAYLIGLSRKTRAV